MTATAVPSASWSLDRLVNSLQRGGWGELDGPANAGLQKVLNALKSLLPWESAEGRLTRAQVADAAGMTPKWAGVCLARLEDLGLISWRRGWLDHGQPRAGWIRVHKTRLAELVRAVRGYLDARKAERRAETRHRLETTLTQRTVPAWTIHRRLSRRWELSSTLPTQGKNGAPRAGLPPHPPNPLPGLEGDTMAACTVCGKAEDACQLTNSKVPDRLRHPFTPGIDRNRLVAAPHELRQSPKRQQLRGWRDLVAEVMRPTHPTLDGLDQ